jgi:hypothetical protein
MAKRSKKNLAEFDAAIDQLGGGVAPISRPRRGVKRTDGRRTKPKAGSRKK